MQQFSIGKISLSYNKLSRIWNKIANSYDNGCKDAVTIKNTLYYLQVIEEKIN